LSYFYVFQNQPALSTPLHNENELLQRLSRGDEAAFELIYNFYQAKLFLYIYPFAKNSKEETEEVLQDVFVKLWTRREALPAIGNFPAYLFRMARNQLFDLQKRKSRDAIAMKSIPDTGNELRSPVHETMIYQEYSAIAKKAIESLTKQRRRIFLMRFENDMSLDEIAGRLKITRNSVKNQLYEAVKLVKLYLKEHGELPMLLLLFSLRHL
jgi:RNA polymerase sigma-70 factor (ECF subfamily)